MYKQLSFAFPDFWTTNITIIRLLFLMIHRASIILTNIFTVSILFEYLNGPPNMIWNSIDTVLSEPYETIIKLWL